MTVNSTTRWLPESPTDRALVLRELDAIVSSHHFRNSKRYPALLRYVVDKTLDGQGDQLKERTLGVEVFDRPPDYDTNADPVVRFSAGEIRKKIAQFYHENGRQTYLEIGLPLGSYAPEFKLRSAARELALEREAIEPPGHDRSGTSAESTFRSVQARANLSERFTPSAIERAALWLTLSLIVAGSVFAYAIRRSSSPTFADKMWGPLLKSPGSVLLVIGNGPHGVLSASATTQPNAASGVHGPYDHISFNEAVALSRLADLLGKRAKPYQIKEADLATLQDIRDRPVVFIGAYNNLWTMQLTEPLRFHFQKEGVLVRIVDTRNPQNRDWLVDYSRPYSSALYDYAIIARYVDPTTKGHTLIVAGIGAYGTQAASEAVATPHDIENLLAAVPPGWENQNLELVIKTAIINGEAGPPSLVSATAW